jgi:hypothetical protein
MFVQSKTFHIFRKNSRSAQVELHPAWTEILFIISSTSRKKACNVDLKVKGKSNRKREQHYQMAVIRAGFVQL